MWLLLKYIDTSKFTASGAYIENCTKVFYYWIYPADSREVCKNIDVPLQQVSSKISLLKQYCCTVFYNMLEGNMISSVKDVILNLFFKVNLVCVH